MRKLIESIFLSLDGLVVGVDEDMGWVMNNFNDEMGKYAGNLQASMGAILLGRVTYQIMTKVWPVNTEETWPGAERMNLVPKFIFSRTLDRAEWRKYDSFSMPAIVCSLGETFFSAHEFCAAKPSR